MSIKAMSTVWDHGPSFKGSELLVLLKFADWANDAGESIHPSMDTIAKRVRLTRSQAQRVVHGLIRDGWIEVVANEYGGAPGTFRHYRLNLEKIAATGRVDAAPSIRETGRTDATGSANATGRTDAVDGSHLTTERGRAGAAQYKYRSVKNHQREAAAACPHAELVALYHELLPAHPRWEVLSDARKRHLGARWDYWRRAGKYSTTEAGLAWWRKFFAFVGESRFLTGNVEPQPGRAPFVADLDFLIGPETHARVIEGKYHEAVAA